MQRRKLLVLVVGAVALAGSGCAAQRTPITEGSVLVGGISARTARELARANNMIAQRPLPPATRRSLARGQALPPGVVFHTMPERMIEGLPEVDGHEWRAAGIDLLLLDTRTLVVVDILRGPLR